MSNILRKYQLLPLQNDNIFSPFQISAVGAYVYLWFYFYFEREQITFVVSSLYFLVVVVVFYLSGHSINGIIGRLRLYTVFMQFSYLVLWLEYLLFTNAVLPDFLIKGTASFNNLFFMEWRCLASAKDRS